MVYPRNFVSVIGLDQHKGKDGVHPRNGVSVCPARSRFRRVCDLEPSLALGRGAHPEWKLDMSTSSTNMTTTS